MTTAQTPEPNQTPALPVVRAALNALRGDDPLVTLREMVASERFIPIIDRSWFDFMCDHGHFPKLGDTPPPWTYCGWLLHQVWIMSYHPMIVPRWPYYLSMLEAGCLTDEPIPRINFASFPPEHNSPMKPLHKLLERLGRFHGYGERTLNVFVDWLAFALAAERTRPEHISAEVNEFLYRNFDLSGWMLYPFDYLGQLLEEFRGKSKRYSGFFLTPLPISTFMAEVLMDNQLDHRGELVVEPACGTGRNLLTASNHSLRLVGIDIDPVCCAIARINGALWAPWLTFPMPEHYFDGIESRTVTIPQTPAPEQVIEYGTIDASSNEAAKQEREPPAHPDATTAKAAPKKYRTDNIHQGSLF